MNNRVKHIQHVVLSTDRPAPTDPRDVFSDFRGSIKEIYAKKPADGRTKLLYRQEAMYLLAKHAREKEIEQERAKSGTYRRYNHIPSQLSSYPTDTVQDRTPMIGSKDKIYSQANCGIFDSVLLAYSNHWNLRTSPDDWWFCVVKTISYAIHVNSYKATVRNMFVAHHGKANLPVEVDDVDGWPVFEDVDFSSFFDSISLSIAKNVKVPEYVDCFKADFTSTTPVEKIVSQITLMSSMQGFFNFLMLGGCGIPAIEMTGTEDDWKKLLSKLKVLKTILEPITEDIGLQDTWWSLVKKIFTNLLATHRGHPDEDWWSRIMTYERPYGSGEYLKSGPPRYSGWIVEFLQGKVGNEIGLLIGDFPSGVVTTPLTIADLETGIDDKGALVAGMVGLTVHESVGNDRPSVQPFQGWSLLLPSDSPFRDKRYAKRSTRHGYVSKEQRQPQRRRKPNY